MAETGRTEDGGYAIKLAGQQWQEVDQATYEAAQQSRMGRLGSSFIDSLQDTAGFMTEASGGGNWLGRAFNPGGALLDQFGLNPIAQGGRRVMEANDAAQAGRMQLDPVAEVGGMVGEALIPLPPVSKAANLSGRFAKTAESVVERVRGRGKGVGAQVTSNPSMASTERVLNGMLTPKELDELSVDFSMGKLYTPADKMALEARIGTGQIEHADTSRQAEELYRTDIVADRLAGRGLSINDIRDTGQGAATKVIMKELGEPLAERLTSTNLNRLRSEIGGKFNQAALQAGDHQFIITDLGKLDDAVTRASANDRSLVESIVDNMKSDMDPTDLMSRKKAFMWRSKLSKEASNAAQAGLYERAQTIGALEDVLDDIVERQLPKDVLESLQEARYQYRIYKALERSTSTTDAGGQVNLRSFLTAFQRRGNRGGRSSSKSVGGDGEKFFKTLETLRYLTERVEPSSGTAQRLIAKTGAGLGGAAVTGAGITAAGGLFGD